MACHMLCRLFGMVYVLLSPVTTKANSVQINLIDNKQAPLVAMLDTASLNKNMKTYINQVKLQSLGNSVKETVQAIIKDEFRNLISNGNVPTLGTGYNQTRDPKWIPIFIACPGNKRSVYRSWLTPAPYDDPLEISPKSVKKIIKEEVFLIDGIGMLTILLTRLYGVDRNFYINSAHGGCPNNFGWLQIIDSRLRSGTTGGCTFDYLYGQEYPYFMYATRNKAGHHDKEAATNSVQINLIDNNKVPLVAMLDTVSLDKNMKTYINQVILQSLGDSVKETVQAIIKEEFEQLISNSSMPTSGTASNQTINSDWIPVFIACPGNKRSVYRSWLTPAPYDETLKISSKTCENDHKRRSIIDRWNRDAEDLIDQVRVDLYKDSQVDAMFLFDGKGSTSVSWFSKERLLQSSYQDLSRTATTNFFSMDGYYSADRHFYINSHHRGCPNDSGWLVIIDPPIRSITSGSGGCSFDHLYGREYPYFIYATRNKACHYDKDGECGFADMMVVSIKRI
ncbi:Hypothetical predicted protein [Mytilus galloprovincialis]|uniref:Uncharacterized protein n=1 Tax=Mytilus galloprovincialis TaxID=29158 RepID=A0A8B6CPQ8_MYTGA|nr:Hypothetical predicted protein [Mytilus galloprovincialis]